MAWKRSVNASRSGWSVDGIDTESGKHRPRQLGTFTSRRSAQRAASAFTESAAMGADHGTVGALVDSWVAGCVHVSARARMQYEWAASQIRRDLGAIRVDRLTREDVARWLEAWPADTSPGAASSSSARSCVLRWPTPSPRASCGAAPPIESACHRRRQAGAQRRRDQGVDRGGGAAVPALDRRAPLGRPDPAGPALRAAPQRAARPELVGRRSQEGHGAHRARPDRGPRPPGLVGRQERSLGARSRSTPRRRRRSPRTGGFQAEERLAAGLVGRQRPRGGQQDTPVSPGNFDQTLERLVAKAGVPRLTSHGLRHTAATHMVRHAEDIGEMRAAADLLGHSPDMLMKAYARIPQSIQTVTDKIAQRSADLRDLAQTHSHPSTPRADVYGVEVAGDGASVPLQRAGAPSPPWTSRQRASQKGTSDAPHRSEVRDSAPHHGNRGERATRPDPDRSQRSHPSPPRRAALIPRTRARTRARTSPASSTSGAAARCISSVGVRALRRWCC